MIFTVRLAGALRRRHFWSMCFATICLLAGTAHAQPAAGESAPKAKARPKRAPRVIQLEALKVSGQVQKPEAFYILQRSELDFKGLEPKKSFVPLILKSVEKDPF